MDQERYKLNFMKEYFKAVKENQKASNEFFDKPLTGSEKRLYRSQGALSAFKIALSLLQVEENLSFEELK